MSSKSKSKKFKPTIKLKTKSAAQLQEEREDLNDKKTHGFTDSTQFHHWLFPSESIINNKRLASLNTQINALKHACPDFSNKYEIPTHDEYFASLSYYSKEIIEICRKFSFPHYVSCTAVSYFKRLFLNSKFNLINIDGMCMKDTAIYLASKTEQCLFENINQLTAVTKIPSKQVVNHELILMDGINFHLKIWNPFRAFRSFLNDFKIIWKKKTKNGLNQIYEQQIIKQGYDLIQDSFISDVCLIYTPSQIALSCFLLTISNVDVKINGNLKDKEKIVQNESEIKDLKSMSVYYFNYRFKDNKDFNKLKNTTQIIQNMIIKGIQKTNHKNYVVLQKNGNTKLYKLQTLYYKIKNGQINKINNNNKNGNVNRNNNRNINGNSNGNINGNVNRNVNVNGGTIKKEKKKKLKLKLNKKRKGNNNNNNVMNGGKTVKRQKILK